MKAYKDGGIAPLILNIVLDQPSGRLHAQSPAALHAPKELILPIECEVVYFRLNVRLCELQIDL